jgi:hypothetical protein
VPEISEVNVGETIDWLTISRPHVALTEVVDVRVEPNARPSSRTNVLELRSTAPLKRKPPTKAEIRRQAMTGAQPRAVDHTTAVSDEFIVFFTGDGEVDYAIDLAQPATGERDLAFTMSFDVLTERTAIIEAVERAVRRAKTVPSGAAAASRNLYMPQRFFLRFEVPSNTPAYTVLFAGSVCYLVLPADHSLKSKVLAHTRARDPWERARAAHQLANYTDPDSTDRLRAMLGDEGMAIIETFSAGRAEEQRVFPARQVAYDGPQYRSIILYHSPEQKAAAEQAIADLEAKGSLARPDRHRGRAAGTFLFGRGVPPGLLRAEPAPALLSDRDRAQGRQVPQTVSGAAQTVTPVRDRARR